MKVLHLFSNSKWTGPAEPALTLCLALRRLGIAADFACSPGSAANKIVQTARDNGLEPILDLYLSKHRHPVRNLMDRRRLMTLMQSRKYEVIHCHLENDHVIGLPVAQRLDVPLVRSNYDGTGFRDKSGRRLLRGAACLIEPSRMALAHDAAQFGLPAERLAYVPPALDLDRFDPGREVPDGRSKLGIPADAFVVGIVARMQTHRHYGDFFEAIARLAGENPRVHAIVVGRGTKAEEVGREPVRKLGLDARVHFSGFIEGEDYIAILKAFDVKVLMKPGTDGTCRAVREAMAMGKPAVVADRGMLAEIVDDGATGLVFDGSAQGLYEALSAMAGEPGRAREMGRAARAKALRDWSLGAQARAVVEVYQNVLARA